MVPRKAPIRNRLSMDISWKSSLMFLSRLSRTKSCPRWNDASVGLWCQSCLNKPAVDLEPEDDLKWMASLPIRPTRLLLMVSIPVWCYLVACSFHIYSYHHITVALFLITEKCQVTLRNSENNCYVVVGDATVFSQNELDDEILDRAREFVAKSMNEGMFDQIHEGIVGVSYYGDSTGNDPQSTVTKSTAEDDSLNPAVIWGPIVGAVVLVAAIAALFVRHNRQRNQTPKPLGTDPLGIRPSTRDDYLHREFSQQTRSSWDVLQHSTTPKKEELGISARGLADSPHEFVEIPKSSWDVLQQSSSSQQQIPLQGMPTQFIEDSSRFIDLGGAQQGEQWEDESVLTG